TPTVEPEDLASSQEPVTAPSADATRAATPRALGEATAGMDRGAADQRWPNGKPPARAIAPAAPPQEEPGLFEDEPTGNTLIRDVVTGPFPRPALLVEPPPFPLLSDLPRSAFMELLANLTVLRLEAGVNVLREGEIGDACYLIAAGSVRVTKAGVELAVLGPGSFFGEFAVLADQRRHASVETVGAVELLEIRRALIDELVAAHPGVARTLRRFYRERLLQTLMATAPFFSGLEPEERVSIAERFRPRRFGRGARIIEEGAPGGGLFLILVGEVQVVRNAPQTKPKGEGAAEELELGRIGEGSYFGEMSLLRGGVASATVRATRMTEVVQLPPRDFYEVVSQHPVLWEQLRSEAERRELANHAILTGEARKSDDGTIYLV
ncbi:MAG TPA: cyclic nucleotide-binding domain-containing protein, partial [Polyangia bacterium]|nr:cyclic nucleotide-binding domain-containing protein [Polyangia bacterium]